MVALLSGTNRLFQHITHFDLKRVLDNLVDLRLYVKDAIAYTKGTLPKSTFKLSFKYLYPIFNERYEWAGDSTSGYFRQDLWAAQKIYAAKPDVHWDFGSSISSFVANLLVFDQTVYEVDIRPLTSNIDNLKYVQGDLTQLDLPDNSIASMSCLHVMEHVGLGRYSDTVDPEGYLKGIAELKRVLAPGGQLYFSVPMGLERLEFNAHRIFDPNTILDLFSDLTCHEFSAVYQGELIVHANPDDYSQVTGFATALFHFEKPLG